MCARLLYYMVLCGPNKGGQALPVHSYSSYTFLPTILAWYAKGTDDPDVRFPAPIPNSDQALFHFSLNCGNGLWSTLPSLSVGSVVGSPPPV